MLVWILGYSALLGDRKRVRLNTFDWSLESLSVCPPQMGEVLYEERLYPAGHWACVTRGDDLYEQSISMGFMKLMRFICKENSAGETLPICSTSVVH